MARNVFLSFLGTNNYSDVTYKGLRQFSDDKSVTTPFTQVARLCALHGRGVEVDAGYIFTTPDARRDNWDKEGRLRDRLTAAGFGETVKAVDITDPKSETEMWRLFNTIAENICVGDDLYVDLTHGFRVMPLLLVSAVGYVAALKGANVREITYGAYDARTAHDGGPPPKPGEGDPLEPDIAPTWDLAPLLELLEWSGGLKALRATGDLRPLVDLVRESVVRTAPVLPALAGADLEEASALVERLADEIAHLDLPSVGGTASQLSERIEAACKAVVNAGDDGLTARPLVQLLDKLNYEIAQIGSVASAESRAVRALPIARWLRDHNAHVAALTMLREGVVDIVARVTKLGDIEDKKSRKAAELVFGALARLGRKGTVDRDRLGAPEDLARQGFERWCELKGASSESWFGGLETLAADVAFVRNRYDHANVSHPPRGEQGHAPYVQGELDKLLDRAERVAQAFGLAEARESTAWASDDSEIDADQSGTTRTPRRMFVLLNHALTDAQRQQAREQLGVASFVAAPDDIQAMWGNIDPSGDEKVIREPVGDVYRWLSKEKATEHDFLLVQGEHGATVRVVEQARKNWKVSTVYATTERRVSERATDDGAVVSEREFRHVQFRRYW